jgi:hypothetical protein
VSNRKKSVKETKKPNVKKETKVTVKKTNTVEEPPKPKNKPKFINSIVDVIAIGVALFIILSIVLSPKMYWITTARWTDNWSEENKTNVVNAMGEENTEERFRLYFQYYNVLHEMGHGLIRYNNGVDIPIAEEEQLVNDFAVAYWRYYGEPEKLDELYDIVSYAVENVGDNYKNGVDYMENAKKHSSRRSFNSDFFNFNDYGWFQFSSVKHSIEQNKSLEEVLKEMGLKDFKLTEKELLIHETINEEESTKIINEAVEKINGWGLYFPSAYQSFSNDPNMNASRQFRNILGIFNLFK